MFFFKEQTSFIMPRVSELLPDILSLLLILLVLSFILIKWLFGLSFGPTTNTLVKSLALFILGQSTLNLSEYLQLLPNPQSEGYLNVCDSIIRSIYTYLGLYFSLQNITYLFYLFIVYRYIIFTIFILYFICLLILKIINYLYYYKKDESINLIDNKLPNINIVNNNNQSNLTEIVNNFINPYNGNADEANLFLNQLEQHFLMYPNYYLNDIQHTIYLKYNKYCFACSPVRLQWRCCCRR